MFFIYKQGIRSLEICIDKNYWLNNMSMISLKDVWLKYRIEFKENGRLVPEDFWVLKNINMGIDKGEVVGIIGENGAGKSTILKVIAGMLKPDKGIVEINGTVSALMEIGAGFQRDLTGRENVYLVSSLFGLTKEQVEEKYDNIVNFAEIGRFINAPVKVYSGGMYMRLAFAIAIYVETDILLVDDIFAVGDIYAQRKCINKMFELKEKGKTIIFVNHDIEVVKKLCSRGIFIREGMIIKDGSTDAVCNYYTETVGSKKGIAILQKGPLTVVFNNGRIILRWKDKALTYNLAGHSVISSSKRELQSIAASWEIQEFEKEDSIMAIGKWADFPVKQHVKITFINEKEFILEIKLDVPEDNIIEKVRTSFIFTNEYKKWLTLEAESEFPETFIDALTWESFMVDGSLGRMIGLMSDNKTPESVPAIIFDRLNDNMDAVCLVANTGFDIRGRAVVYDYYIGNMRNSYPQNACRCFISRIRLFENKEPGELQQYISHAKQIMQESVIIRKNLLSIICKDHNIEIYWMDKLLTRGIGLNTYFKCQDKIYKAADGCWAICKENSEEIIITISWYGRLPFNQIWKLRLQNDNVFIWEIEMKVDEKIKIRNKETELVLSEEYERWITNEEEGDFNRLENKGSAVILNKYINENIGVEAVYKKDDFRLPNILFNCEDETPRTSYIFKAKEEGSLFTKLRYLEIDFKENLYTLPGNYKYFKGKIKIGADSKEAVPSANKIMAKKIISINKLSLIFDCGKGKILRDGTELTKGLGLYTSFFFRDRWHDSSQAFWDIKEAKERMLVAVGHWPLIPVLQKWEFLLLDENTILWKIGNEIWEDVILEKSQVNLMLSDKYKEWFTNKRIYGKFPERFNAHNGLFWDKLWYGDPASIVGVKKHKIEKNILNRKYLPSISFSCSADCSAISCSIENADELFQARILQYELDTRDKACFQDDKYFNGQIKLAI